MRQLDELIANERRLLDVRASALARADSLRARALLAAADYEAVYAQQLQQQSALGRLLLQQGELRAQQAELHKQQLRLAAEQDTTVVAPMRGRVAAVLREEGMGVGAQEPVLMLLPDGAELIFSADRAEPSAFDSEHPALLAARGRSRSGRQVGAPLRDGVKSRGVAAP